MIEMGLNSIGLEPRGLRRTSITALGKGESYDCKSKVDRVDMFHGPIN